MTKICYAKDGTTEATSCNVHNLGKIFGIPTFQPHNASNIRWLRNAKPTFMGNAHTFVVFRIYFLNYFLDIPDLF